MPSVFGLTYIADVSPAHLKLEKGDLKDFDVTVKNGDSTGIELLVSVDNPSDNLQLVGKDRQVLILGGGEEKRTSFRFYAVDWVDNPILMDINLEFNGTILDSYSYLVTIERNETTIVLNANDTISMVLTELNYTNATIQNLTLLAAEFNQSILALQNDKNNLLNANANLTERLEAFEYLADQPKPFDWSVIIYGTFALIVALVILFLVNKLRIFDNLKRAQRPYDEVNRRSHYERQADLVNNLSKRERSWAKERREHEDKNNQNETDRQ